jgi:hypothetical protein
MDGWANDGLCVWEQWGADGPTAGPRKNFGWVGQSGVKVAFGLLAR